MEHVHSNYLEKMNNNNNKLQQKEETRKIQAIPT